MWPFTTPASTANQEAAPPSACPVDHETRQEWLKDQKSTPPATRTRPGPPEHRLSEEREVSSIPRWLPPSSPSAEPSTASSSSSPATPPSACPAHDPNFDPKTTPPLNSAEKAAIVPSESNWVYPSPSSFYRALSAKDRNPNPQDMDIVVPIHNAVNERVWQQVLDWERSAMGLKEGEETGVKLVSFMGRPKQMSPRARWKSFIGYVDPSVLSRPGKSLPLANEFLCVAFQVTRLLSTDTTGSSTDPSAQPRTRLHLSRQRRRPNLSACAT